MTVGILVVDDEPDMIELFRRRFRRELRNGEYTLHFADSGESALQTLHDGTEPEVEVMLSDINMPGISGLDLLREAKGHWPDLPVVMISAYGDRERRETAIDFGAADFLPKPIDFGALKARIPALI